MTNKKYLEFKKHSRTAINYLNRRRIFFIGLTLATIWCIPYIATGNKMEWGDFSFFAQAHEAIKISISEYHQFPWWNPWVSGGVPLYANPQIGVFSITTVLSFIFGVSIALKLTLVIFTIAGYVSMYTLLHKHFKIRESLATPLALTWIFCSFFVAHLPAHVSFMWYMVAPFFIYIVLNLSGWKKGIIFGLAFAIMALSQTHNPFVHITFVCGIILTYRLIVSKNKDRVLIAKSILSMILVFILIAGHRVLMTYENLYEFSRNIVDVTPNALVSISGLIIPYTYNLGSLTSIYPEPPLAPHGFHEITGSIGLFGIISLLSAFTFFIFCMFRKKKFNNMKQASLVLICLIATLLLGLGDFFRLSPYSILKELPIFGDMRIPSRWYIWTILSALIYIGLVANNTKKKTYERFLMQSLTIVTVLELFLLNIGYQTKLLVHQPVISTYNKGNSFIQQSYFGSLKTNDYSGPPQAYREYESTLMNIGVLYANDALVQIPLANRESPRCGKDKGCSLLMTNNAVVKYWSPNRIELERTGNGNIELNINESSYIKVNGAAKSIRTSEPFEKFTISDESKNIAIEYKPSIGESIKSILQPKPESDYKD